MAGGVVVDSGGSFTIEYTVPSAPNTRARTAQPHTVAMPRTPSLCVSAAGVEGVEFVSPPANVSNAVDDNSHRCHCRYRTISNVLATTEPVAAQVGEDGEPDKLLLLSNEEPSSFKEAEHQECWRKAM
ncbi:hypothetical protein E2562_035616 [Oryza meyeriana var. granulata]|uniref:Uncharacterized protein n=1 Tax=Oryza meyeriana var. granulata TaxID=110450 RepID=A0A6G1C9X8_9ORYZ|nr:hypothetical protein E2562_035616 [Oryza meyeriana var. granulata]